MKEQVRSIPISQLHPFREPPFQVRNDDAMDALCDSIRAHGVLSPLLARPSAEEKQLRRKLRRSHEQMTLLHPKTESAGIQ